MAPFGSILSFQKHNVVTVINDMRSKIEVCLSQIQLLLIQNKSSYQIADANDVAHQYSDKYLLAEYLINTSVACIINDMQLFGNFKEKLPMILKWCEQNSISYRFECQQNCTFDKEIEREVENPFKVEKNNSNSSFLFDTQTTTTTITKVINTIKEYVYKFQVTYKFIIFSGVGDNSLEYITIATRQVYQDIITNTKVCPYPEIDHYKFDINMTWLFQILSIYHPKESDEDTSNTTTTTAYNNITSTNVSHYKPSFRINRSKSDCYTPSHNSDIKEAKKFFDEYGTWINKVVNHFKNNLFQIQVKHNNNITIKNKTASIDAINVEDIFNLTFPLLIQNSSEIITTTTANKSFEEQVSSSNELIQYKDPDTLVDNKHTTILPCSIVNELLDEKHRTILNKCEEMETLFPASDVIISSIEAKLLVILMDIKVVTLDVMNGIDYIEKMIRTQLVAAIGKELKSNDFARYMDYHNSKLFKHMYQPKPFSYSVRRSMIHSPEGQIRIETSSSDAINTISSCSIPSNSVAVSDLEHTYIQFPLNASTNIRFGGERYIHGWLAHRFTGESPPSLKLIAQARQFSCYIVLIGRMNSAKVFQPKYGFIAQSKDEFTIPLELEQIPTAKEFKDSIESLSPEQQRFAKAYRSMQLESTLFAVCIIQIKPQLEKVLNLIPDSLTKEIKLTQDLIKLFINHQIPTDLLSYDESMDMQPTSISDSMNQQHHISDSNSRLLSVKEHVQNIQSMLNQTKNEELQSRKLEVVYEKPFSSSFGAFGVPSSTTQRDHMNNGLTFGYSANNNSLGGYNNTSAPLFGGFDRTLIAGSEDDCATTASIFEGFGPPNTTQVTSTNSAASILGGFGSSTTQGAFTNAAAPMLGGFGSSTTQVTSTNAAAPIIAGFGSSTTQGAFTSSSLKSSIVANNLPPSPSSPPTSISGFQGKKQIIISGNINTDYPNSEDIVNDQIIDYTKFPTKLDATYEQLDPESKFHTTIINVGKIWEKTSNVSLLSNSSTTSMLVESSQDHEKHAAFDLLDALTKSGTLPIEYATLHVIVAGYHYFDQSLMDVIVCKNINPIERVERSTLIMATTLHDLPVQQLINYDQIERVSTYSPMVFIKD